ncbi:MAG: DUF3108 domain-containing protein [Verrucomicrobiia bacterium]
MKKIVVIAELLLAVAVSSWANGGENFPFHVGEKLTYQIFWGPFVAGRASLEVQGIERVDGHDCYHLVAQARTSGLAELLFHVDSTTESWLDVNQLFTRRYRENRVEGKKARNNETVYDYDHKQAVSTNLLNGKTSAMPLDQPVQDVVSALYYVRVQQLKPSIENNFLINAGSTNYSVHVRPDLRKTLWIRPLGDVAAMRIEPKPTLSIVAANKGRMWFWVSDDNRKLPLLVASDMKIGSAKLVLFKVESDTPETNTRPSTAASNFGTAHSEPTTSSAAGR